MLWYMGYIPELEGFERLASDFQEQFAEFSEEEKLAAWGAVSEFAKGISDSKVLGKIAPKINQTAKGAFKTAPAQVPAVKADNIKNALGAQFSRVGQIKGPVISNAQGAVENTLARNNAPVANKTAEELTPDDLEIFAERLAKSAGADDGMNVYTRVVADALSEALPAAARISNQQRAAGTIDPNTGLPIVEEQQKTAAYNRNNNNNRRNPREQSFADKYPKITGALMLGGVGLAGGASIGAYRKYKAEKAVNKAVKQHFGSTINEFGGSADDILEGFQTAKSNKDKKFADLAKKYSMNNDNVAHMRSMYDDYNHDVDRVRNVRDDLTKADREALAKKLSLRLTRIKMDNKIPTELLDEMHDNMLKQILFAQPHLPAWPTIKANQFKDYNY